MVERIISISTINKAQIATIPVDIRNILGVTLGEDIVWLQKDDRVVLHSTRKPLIGRAIDVSRIASTGMACVPKRVRNVLGIDIGQDIVFILDEKTGDVIVQSTVIKEEGREDIVRHKLEIALELICLLYKHKFIEDAYIVGSVATGKAKKESDVDIVIINPLFESIIEFMYFQNAYEEDPMYNEMISEFHPVVKQIIELLENIGVRSQFKETIKKPGTPPELGFYQIYKDELVQIWGGPDVSYIKGSHIRITKDGC